MAEERCFDCVSERTSRIIKLIRESMETADYLRRAEISREIKKISAEAGDEISLYGEP